MVFGSKLFTLHEITKLINGVENLESEVIVTWIELYHLQNILNLTQEQISIVFNVLGFSFRCILRFNDFLKEKG